MRDRRRKKYPVKPAEGKKKTVKEELRKDVVIRKRRIRGLKNRKPAPVPSFKDGCDGFVRWVEEFVYLPIYPEGESVVKWVKVGELPRKLNVRTRKSYRGIWEGQKEVLQEALRMENGRFVYRLIVFCWMRGEGKSLLACLIQLWKFFNWPRQQIMLGANSRDQVKFVHFDIMRDVIVNSPELLKMVGGKRNMQEKEIRLKDTQGNVRSIIRSISSFSGIVSNITGYTFSEIFDMKNPKFFVQLDGSIRNIPNAFGVIDSTVSEKTHVLYKLFRGARSGKLKTVFFSYRFSKNGVMEDYWNPHMDDEQLEDYRLKFPLGEFERYFLNLWSAGRVQVFTDRMVEEMYYMGKGGEMLCHEKIKQVIHKKNDAIEAADKFIKGRGSKGGVRVGEVVERSSINRVQRKVDEWMGDMIKVEDHLSLQNSYHVPQIASVDDLMRVGDLLDTNWCILAGLDMADPMAVRSPAKTIFTVMAKGLPGSRTNPFLMTSQSVELKYFYFLLHLYDNKRHDTDTLKKEIMKCHGEYGGIDSLCSERYGAWDLPGWCEERDIRVELIYPTYDRQREAFKELFTLADEGRLKAASVGVMGKRGGDILREEMGAFDHRPKEGMRSGWFGSPEKLEKNGIQDDAVFSLNWCIYAGRNLGVLDFRALSSGVSFGDFVPNKTLLGNYA